MLVKEKLGEEGTTPIVRREKKRRMETLVKKNERRVLLRRKGWKFVTKRGRKSGVDRRKVRRG